MAPTTKFFLPDDDDTDDYSSENRDPISLSSSEVPRSLLVEGYLTHQKTETEIFPPYIERMPEHTKVVKGFFPVEPEPKPAKDKSQYDPVPFGPDFPPLSNKAYYLTSDGHDPKFARDMARVIVTMPSRRKLTELTKTVQPSGRLVEVAENVNRRRESLSDTPTPTRSRTGTSTSPEPTVGQELAGTIDWNRSGWEAPVPGAANIYSTEEQRADFIKVIDDYAKTSLQGFRRDGPHLLIPPVIDPANTKIIYEYCKKCGKNHIPPGSPVTLPDRDTCGAYLPDWFPSHNYKQPWENFRGLYNKIVLCEEAERGFKHSSLQSMEKVWDKEYHDEHPKWYSIGRRMGWWKCGIDTEVERNCELCHKPNPAAGVEPIIDPENAGTISDQRKYLEKWIEEHMKAVGMEDKAIAEEMIRRMKPQEVLGYFGDYKVPAEELEGYNTGNDSDPDGEKEMPRRPNLNPMENPIATPSTLDLSEKGGLGEKEMSEKETPTASSSSECLVMRAGRSFFAK